MIRSEDEVPMTQSWISTPTRRQWLVAAGGMAGLVLGGPLWAQGGRSRRDVPAYAPADIVHGLHAFWSVPRAEAFTVRTQALFEALRALDALAPSGAASARAELEAARVAWIVAMLAWERLSAVGLGPLVERRVARRIDFAPARPSLIEHAIQTQPQGPAAMERIGTPAKGLPALEWLLWVRPETLAPGSAASRYAVEAAAALLREAQALQTGFQDLATRTLSDTGEAAAGLGEFVNQWVGGLERLRWAHMEKPLRARGTELPRAASGQTVDSWSAQWTALRALAVWDPEEGPMPSPGHGLVPLENCLRARRLTAHADALVQHVGLVTRRLQAVRGTPTLARVQGATQAMAVLRRWAETRLAPALDVSLQFSDADGD